MSKKILSLLVLGSLFTVLLVPMMVSAQEEAPESCTLGRTIELNGDIYPEGETVGPIGESVDNPTDDWGTICLFNTIYGVTDLLFGILLALAVLFFVYGGVTMVMASGDAEKFTKGKDYIMYALIGIFVALIAKALPSIIKTAMGM